MQVAMLRLFGNQRYRKEDSNTFKRNYVHILQSVEAGRISSRDIASFIGRELSNTRATLKRLTEQWYLRRNIIDLPNGGNEFTYELLPKGMELLEKRPMTKTMKEIGKDIGVDRNTVGKAIHLIEKADQGLKLRLTNGTLTIGQAFQKMTGRQTVKYKRVNAGTKLQCPSCGIAHMKKEYEIIEV